MKKIIPVLLVLMILLSGCAPPSQVNDALIKEQEQTISAQKAEIAQLDAKRAELDAMVIDLKVEKDVAQYVLTVEVGQTHLTLDFTKHIKDAMNKAKFQLPVTKEFYDKVQVGDVIDDSFRAGSFWMEGSIGNWKVKIVGKEIR